MTEFEIASAIQNYVTSHRGVTDSPISLRQIRDEVDTLRLRLLDELLRAKSGIGNVSAYNQVATFSTVKDKSSIIAIIPELYYRPNNKLEVTYLGGLSGDTPFKVVSGGRKTFADYDMVTASAPTAKYTRGVFRFSNVVPKKIYIEAIFNKPSTLTKYGYNWKTSQYPVPYGVIDTIIGKTVESYIRTNQPTLPTPNTQSDENAQSIQQIKQ